jgi:hypothetical protein
MILVRNNAKRARVGFDKLARAPGPITIAQNPALPTLDFSVLPFTNDGITISSNQSLPRLTAAALTSAGMDVTNNPALPTCQVTSLFARIAGGHTQPGQRRRRELSVVTCRGGDLAMRAWPARGPVPAWCACRPSSPFA